MAMWRLDRHLNGPEPASARDIEPINRLFAEAFTDRYTRDGLTGVRVPPLAAGVWRYAIETAGPGAMLWRDDDGRLVAFNMCHRSGIEGWMGPIAVRADRQGQGVGRTAVQTGIDWLVQGGAQVVGLETMPRTIDNIGFYSRIGFVPRHLTISMIRDGARGKVPRERLSRSKLARGAEQCNSLAARLVPGLEFKQELELTAEHQMGDTTVVLRRGEPVAFAIWHGAPLAAGRERDELRVLKLVALDLEAFDQILAALEADAAEERLRRVAIRCQTQYEAAWRKLVKRGYRAHWTDLRMTLPEYPEKPVREGVLFSNWEI